MEGAATAGLAGACQRANLLLSGGQYKSSCVKSASNGRVEDRGAQKLRWSKARQGIMI